MVPSLCVLAFAFLPWPRPATTRVSSVAYLGAGGDSGRGRGRGRGDVAAVSPLSLTCASRPRRHPASRACVEDLGQLKVPQLKQRLRAAGLKASGRKAELVHRLLGTEAELSTDAASMAEAPDAASSSKAPLGTPAAAASAEAPLVSPDAAASAEAHGRPGSPTAASSAEVQGATGLHPGASLPTSTFSLVHADASLLVVDKGAGTQVVTRRLSCQYLRRVSELLHP